MHSALSAVTTLLSITCNILPSVEHDRTWNYAASFQQRTSAKVLDALYIVYTCVCTYQMDACKPGVHCCQTHGMHVPGDADVMHVALLATCEI